MAIVVGACALVGIASAGEVIRITCADGGGDMLEGNGHTVFAPGLCDADHACDGFCTFAFDPLCPICLSDFSGRLTCSPDAHAEVCPGLPALPCRAMLPHVVLDLGNRGRAHKRVHVRFGGRNFTIVLRCEYGGQCPGTLMQFPEPGVPDLTGDWSIEEGRTDTDCPAAVLSDFQPPSGLRVAQSGVAVFACDRAQGTVLDSTLSLGSVPRVYDGLHAYTEHTTGPVPNGDGPITLTESWTITRADPPGGPTICTRTATAAMSRIPAVRCARVADCVALDACFRCTAGVCRSARFCQ